MVDFDIEEIFFAVLQKIRVRKSERNSRREEYLLCQSGRFEIETGKFQEINFSRKFPDFSALFQLNRKLYIGGGRSMNAAVKGLTSKFYSCDYSGESVELQPLKHEGGAFSISGVYSHLVSVGGWNLGNLKTCAQY